MKRDMDFLRQLLLHIEANDGYNGSSYGPVLGKDIGRDEDITLYHMKLLADAGYVDVVTWLAHGAPLICGLTSQGHDFLDSIRDQDIWDKTQEGMKKAGGFSLDLVKALAKGLIKKNIERYTGVGRSCGKKQPAASLVYEQSLYRFALRHPRTH